MGGGRIESFDIIPQAYDRNRVQTHRRIERGIQVGVNYIIYGLTH